MIYSKNGLHLTEQFEGCRLKAYQDSVGVWTIGYGHTFNGSPSATCTQEQAEGWLSEDVMTASNAVNRLVHVPINQNEFDALVDFTFNLGAGRLATSTMLDLLNAGDHIAAAAQFEKWDMAGGKHVAGLLRRRQTEKSLFMEKT